MFLRYLPEENHHPFFRAFNLLRGSACKRIFKKSGRNLQAHRQARFGTGRNLSIGDDSNLGVNAFVNTRGGVTIGDNVMMGPDVIILTGRHTFDSLDLPIQNQPTTYAPVEIGNDVWLGTRVVVIAGVKIGDGCVVGANSVVTKDIPPYSVAVGVPVRVVKNRQQALKQTIPDIKTTPG